MHFLMEIIFLVPMLTASGTFAVLRACVCMYVCVSVCLSVCVLRQARKRENSETTHGMNVKLGQLLGPKP